MNSGLRTQKDTTTIGLHGKNKINDNQESPPECEPRDEESFSLLFPQLTAYQATLNHLLGRLTKCHRDTRELDLTCEPTVIEFDGVV